MAGWVLFSSGAVSSAGRATSPASSPPFLLFIGEPEASATSPAVSPPFLFLLLFLGELEAASGRAAPSAEGLVAVRLDPPIRK
jgi:hypothetical protein